jgi:hypothetical protein
MTNLPNGMIAAMFPDKIPSRFGSLRYSFDDFDVRVTHVCGSLLVQS